MTRRAPCGERAATLGDEVFANLLIGQINKFVKDVDVRQNVAVEIEFVDGSKILISLRPEHYAGPEAIELLRLSNKKTVVI